MHLKDLIPNQTRWSPATNWRATNWAANVDENDGERNPSLTGNPLRQSQRPRPRPRNYETDRAQCSGDQLGLRVIQRLNPQDLTIRLVLSIWGNWCSREMSKTTWRSSRAMSSPFFRRTISRFHSKNRASSCAWKGVSHRRRLPGRSGETVRHLVERVGGFTPNAYLYGAEFTRESCAPASRRDWIS